jgi:hypothetical protein
MDSLFSIVNPSDAGPGIWHASYFPSLHEEKEHPKLSVAIHKAGDALAIQLECRIV